MLLEMVEFLLREDSFRVSDYVNDSNLHRDMIAYVQKHYAEKVSLAMLAEEFHMSEKYISRYFKEQFAISFTQYVSHLRMDRAKDLLRNSDLSVTELALSSGYPSVNFFIRSFKEMNQITPLQYRKHFRFS